MNGYPTVEEFAAYIVAEGIVESVPDASVYDDALADAILKWDQKTLWYPFYIEDGSSDSTGVFQWEQGGEGVIVLPNKAIVSITSLSVGEFELTSDDYILAGKNKGGTYNYIQLKRSVQSISYPVIVTVVGVFGFTQDIKVDVKRAIFAYMLSDGGVMDQLTGNFGSGAVSKEKQGSVEITYGQATQIKNLPPTGLRNVYSARWRDTVTKYKRRVA